MVRPVGMTKKRGLYQDCGKGRAACPLMPASPLGSVVDAASVAAAVSVGCDVWGRTSDNGVLVVRSSRAIFQGSTGLPLESKSCGRPGFSEWLVSRTVIVSTV